MTMQLLSPGNTRSMNVCEKFCILRVRSSWFALPATSVREVVTRPAIVPVPGTPDLLEGLCHVRAEFIPVLRLALLIGEGESSDNAEEQQIVVMTAAQGAWGAAINQVVALEPLEVAINPDEQGQTSFVMGSTNYRGQFVRVLNPAALLRRAHAAMNDYWKDQRVAARV